jgi:hypothetical protein
VSTTPPGDWLYTVDQVFRHNSSFRRILLLSGLYARFTEGFDTKDLREAKGLLDNLSQ